MGGGKGGLVATHILDLVPFVRACGFWVAHDTDKQLCGVPCLGVCQLGCPVLHMLRGGVVWRC